MPCTREYRHDPHPYNAVGVEEKQSCQGRRRKPLRTILLFFRALKEPR